MITEEYVKSYPHTFKNGIYLFATYSRKTDAPGELRFPKVVDYGSCPYCGSICVNASDRNDGGWRWGLYECGVEMAGRPGLPGVQGKGPSVLGITPQTDSCRLSVMLSNSHEDTI